MHDSWFLWHAHLIVLPVKEPLQPHWMNSRTSDGAGLRWVHAKLFPIHVHSTGCLVLRYDMTCLLWTQSLHGLGARVVGGNPSLFRLLVCRSVEWVKTSVMFNVLFISFLKFTVFYVLHLCGPPYCLVRVARWSHIGLFDDYSVKPGRLWKVILVFCCIYMNGTYHFVDDRYVVWYTL